MNIFVVIRSFLHLECALFSVLYFSLCFVNLYKCVQKCIGRMLFSPTFLNRLLVHVTHVLSHAKLWKNNKLFKYTLIKKLLFINPLKIFNYLWRFHNGKIAAQT